MYALEINPLWLEIGGPAAAAGVVLGALAGWLVARRRSRALEAELDETAALIKSQEAVEAERQAFERPS